jgi:hypothetical protein
MNAEAVPQNDDEMAINQPNNRFVVRQGDKINYLSTLRIFMKQTTYLATLPNPPTQHAQSCRCHQSSTVLRKQLQCQLGEPVPALNGSRTKRPETGQGTSFSTGPTKGIFWGINTGPAAAL